MTASEAGLPQSPILGEAEVLSMTELMSMNPEKYTREHIARMVVVFRAQRERFAQAQKELASKPKAGRALRATSTEATLDDLGI